MCILKKTDGPCVKGPGTGGRASQKVAHAVEVRSKHGFGNAPGGKNALTDRRKRVWGGSRRHGRAVGKSCNRLPAGSGISFFGQGRTCLPAEGAGLGNPSGRGKQGGGAFFVKTGSPSFKEDRPQALPVGRTGSCGRYGVAIGRRGSCCPGPVDDVPADLYEDGRSAEGPQWHRPRLPGRVPV